MHLIHTLVDVSQFTVSILIKTLDLVNFKFYIIYLTLEKTQLNVSYPFSYAAAETTLTLIFSSLQNRLWSYIMFNPPVKS